MGANAREQVLVMLFAGQASCSLVPGFKVEDAFNLPPRVLYAEFIVLEQCCGRSGPSMELTNLPIPFH